MTTTCGPEPALLGEFFRTAPPPRRCCNVLSYRLSYRRIHPLSVTIRKSLHDLCDGVGAANLNCGEFAAVWRSISCSPDERSDIRERRARISLRSCGLQQPAPGEIAHQRGGAEAPGRRAVAGGHHVDERAE